jgi:hypothetical protein
MLTFCSSSEKANKYSNTRFFFSNQEALLNLNLLVWNGKGLKDSSVEIAFFGAVEM